MKIMKKMAIMTVFATFLALAQTLPANASGATSGMTLEVNVQEVIALDCGSSIISLGVVTPGVPAIGNSTCVAVTNANGGYNLSVMRNDATSTMKKDDGSVVNIPDKISWDPAGTGNARSWSGTGLGFTVYASTANKNPVWWGDGASVTDESNKYAGFAPTQTDVMRYEKYSEVATATNIGYKLDIPLTQKSGIYSGSITYQATMIP